MSVLLLASESIPPGWDRYAQLAGVFLTALGYTATFRSSTVANESFEARLLQAKFSSSVTDRIVETTRHMELAEEYLNSAPDDKKWDFHQRFTRLREERAGLIAQQEELERGLLSSAVRARIWADLMLLLMVLGVAGGAALLVLQMFVVAPFVVSVAPGAYVAYRRLNTATKDASGMAHDERMRQLEFEEKKLELEDKRREISEKQESRELDAESRRIELLGKKHELQAKLYRSDERNSD
jgi:hypothetical protein